MSCTLIIEKKVEVLKQMGIVKSDLTVDKTNREAKGELARASKAIRQEFYQNYGVEIPTTTPVLGVSKKTGKIQQAKQFNDLEKGLKDKADKRYLGIKEEQFYNEAGEPIEITGDDLTAFLLGDGANMKGRYTPNTKALEKEANKKEGGKLVNKGLANLINDLSDNQNIDLVAAAFPSKFPIYISNYVSNAKEVKKKVDTALKSGYTEETLLNEAVRESGVQELITINEMLDSSLGALDINFTTTMSSDVGMRYAGNASAGNINVNPMAVGIAWADKTMLTKNLAKTYVHEKAHMLTIGLLNSNAKYRAEMTALYQKAIDAGIAEYGMSNLHEFVAEALSNKEFQTQLAKIPSDENQDKTLYDKVIDLILKILSDHLGIEVQGTVLGDIIVKTDMATRDAIKAKDKLYNIGKDSYEILQHIDYKGVANFPEDFPLSKVYAWAKANKLAYNPDTKRFYIQAAQTIALSKDSLTYHLDYDKNKFFYQMNYLDKNNETYDSYLDYLEDLGEEDTNNIAPRTPLMTDLKEFINGDIEKLKAEKILSPADTREGLFYKRGAVEYFRSTNYLGSDVDASKMIIRNAVRIGNIADELSKRIFSEESATFEEVAEFVKIEAIARYEKGESNVEGVMESPSENEIKTFKDNYKEPVSKAAFEALKTSMLEAKQLLTDELKVKKFHADIVVWDDGPLVAGEIDILAELEDGSFTVIDMKTRRKGAEGYDAKEIDSFNTKNKHSRQTNLYSNMLEKMGFTVNAPKIIMAQFEYPMDEEAVNSEISEIQPGQHISIFSLARNKNSFDFSSFTNQTLGKNKIEAMRAGYHKFKAVQDDVLDWIDKPGAPIVRDKQKALIHARFVKLNETIERYKNILALKDQVLSKNLENLVVTLENEVGKSLEEISYSVQLNVAAEFFDYAQQELQALMKDLRENKGDKTTYLRIEDYFGVFNIAQELFDDLEAGKEAFDLQNEEYEQVAEMFKGFAAINTSVSRIIKSSLIEIATDIFTESYYGSKFEIDHINKVRKEGEDLGLTGAELTAYINKARSSAEVRREIDTKYKEEIETLLSGVNYDMNRGTYMLVSDVMTNNDFVQLIHNKLLNAEQRFTNTANQEVMDLAKVKAATQLTQSDVEELIVKDKDGYSYLIGATKIGYFDEYNTHREAIREIKSREKGDLKAEIKNKQELEKAQKAFNAWKKANQEIEILPEGPTFRPAAKWRQNLKTMLTTDQLTALQAFVGVVGKSENRIGKRSLIARTNLNDASFIRLPGIKQTVFGGLVSGNLMNAAKKFYQEATQIEIDDTEEGGATDENSGKDIRLAYTDLNGKIKHMVPVQFRGRLKEQQNTDLFSVFASELQNGIRYEIDKEVAVDAMIIQDMINNTKFHKTEGNMKTKIGSIFAGKGDTATDTIDGDASIVSEMIDKMFKTRVYQMSNEYAGNIPIPRVKKIGKDGKEIERKELNIDIHRAAQVVSTYTAFASMAFKGLTAANNWLTGNVSVAIEAAGGEFINAKGILRAKAIYAKNLMGIVGDIGSPIQTNFVNQLMRKLGVQHEVNILNAQFERNNVAKKFIDPGFALGGFSMGEHEIHATLSIAILDNIKVLNSKGEFLDKEGNMVEDRKDAASLLDSYYIDDTGIIQQYKWASDNFNEHETQSRGEDQGESAIRGLIKDRVYRTQGAFDKRMASQIDRLWYGKLLKQFKKHIIPQTLNRFRGLAHVAGSTEKGEKGIADKDRYFNYNAKTEEYGYYVSFLRFAHNVFKQERFNILNWKEAGSNTWKTMTKHQRANVTKTISELGFMTFVLSLSALLAAAAQSAGDAGDDDEALWAASYLLRRQSQESSLQYLDPRAQWRVFESPFAALRHIQLSMDTIEQVFSPADEFTSGVHAGENKLWSKVKRVSIVGDRLEQFKEGYAKRLFVGLANSH